MFLRTALRIQCTSRLRSPFALGRGRAPVVALAFRIAHHVPKRQVARAPARTPQSERLLETTFALARRVLSTPPSYPSRERAGNADSSTLVLG